MKGAGSAATASAGSAAAQTLDVLDVISGQKAEAAASSTTTAQQQQQPHPCEQDPGKCGQLERVQRQTRFDLLRSYGPLMLLFGVAGIATLGTALMRSKWFSFAWTYTTWILAAVFYFIWINDGHVLGVGTLRTEPLFIVTVLLVVAPLVLLMRFRNQITPDFLWLKNSLKVPL